MLYLSDCYSQATVTQLNDSSPRDPNTTKQYTSNNKDAFKYRHHRGQLPAWLSLARARITVHDVVVGQSDLSLQMSSDNRMLLKV